MSINFINFRFVFNTFLFLWILFIPFKNAFYQASTFLLIVTFFIYVVVNKDYKYVKEIIVKYKDIVFAFLLILISMTISNLINDVSKTNAWYLELAYLHRYALILLILFYFYSKDFFDKNLLITFILISLGLQILDGLYQYIVGYDLFLHNIGNKIEGLTGPIFNRNVFGLLMGMGVIVSFLSIKFASKITLKILLVTLLVLFIFTTLFTYSRAVWVALIASFLAYIIVNIRNFNKLHFFYFFIALCIAILVFFNIDSLQNRFIELIHANSSNRNEIWLYCLDLFKQKMFFGWGLNAWKINGLQDYANVHNSLLEILISLGIFGFIVFTYFLYLVFKQIKNTKNFNAFYVLIFLIVDSLFDQSIISGKIFLNIIVILVFYIYLDRIRNDKKGELLI